MKRTAEQVWNECLTFIEGNVSPNVFDTWFKPIRPVKLEDRTLTIEVPSPMYYEWLETHYLDLLRAALTRVLGRGAGLMYQVRMSNRNPRKKALTFPASAKPPVDTRNPLPSLNGGGKTPPNPFVIPGIQKIKIDSNLNPHYTFDNFIEGPNNRLARNAGLSIAKRNTLTFNPLFIYGGVGLGKTHIANAIGVEVKRRSPDKNVLYVSMEKFVQQYVAAATNSSRADFINFYQMVDVLIIDDVQFLAGKSRTQDVFFHIFNHLHREKKQLIFTSDKAPIDLKDVEGRILSRFNWGLTAELKAPDYKTRLQIIRHKLREDGVEMPDEVVEYIASQIKTNIRDIEGVLTGLIAQATFNQREINLDLAREVVGNFVKQKKPEFSCDMIKQIVAQYFGLTMKEFESNSRKRTIVQARQISMYLAKKYTKASLETIGRHIGKKDHATVVYSLQVVRNLIDVDKKFRHIVRDIEALLVES
ncbi:MAG: chromosomal replication initiator protein DnaA [Chlorobi bacterium]|nr:chromosomal replication initiator protein DnaA [Chlorobiota bacterium]